MEGTAGEGVLPHWGTERRPEGSGEHSVPSHRASARSLARFHGSYLQHPLNPLPSEPLSLLLPLLPLEPQQLKFREITQSSKVTDTT